MSIITHYWIQIDSRIYKGNVTYVSTLKDMITDMKVYSETITDEVVVLDAGFYSEENLEHLSIEQLIYLGVSRKRLKDYQLDQEATLRKIQDKRCEAIDLQVCTSEGYADTWMCVQSERKRVKEQSMTDKITDCFEEELLAYKTD